MRLRLGVLLGLVGLTFAPSAQAAHHLWRFSEAFSNASGTVQFVELSCPSSGESALGPFTVTAGANTFNFVTNLPPGDTAGSWVLLATAGFGSLPGGVTPDYLIPSNFFATGGGNLNYASGIDSWNYGAVPTDGIHSLLKNGSTAVNSPTNFGHQSGSVNLSAPVPALQTWGLFVLVGAMLLVASGLLKRRAGAPAAA
jgi:hypothetical protein